MGDGADLKDISKTDLQMLFQDLAQARRDLQTEYRESSRKIQEERERSRWDLDRLRKESDEKVRGLERENEALVRALGRVQGENEKLREENAVLRVPRKVEETVTVLREPEARAKPKPEVAASGTDVDPRRVTIVPPMEPPLGRSVPINQVQP